MVANSSPQKTRSISSRQRPADDCFLPTRPLRAEPDLATLSHHRAIPFDSGDLPCSSLLYAIHDDAHVVSTAIGAVRKEYMKMKPGVPAPCDIDVLNGCRASFLSARPLHVSIAAAISLRLPVWTAVGAQDLENFHDPVGRKAKKSGESHDDELQERCWHIDQICEHQPGECVDNADEYPGRPEDEDPEERDEPTDEDPQECSEPDDELQKQNHEDDDPEEISHCAET
ncbi:hypothetical protein Daus18300_007762 [Diaporthe australafricana]|uniref:Uncharacterized protein n=1 Tax=Diaporthe australafricana TaxID=127596 RepID=A0ABR3WLG2_9PEZI